MLMYVCISPLNELHRTLGINGRWHHGIAILINHLLHSIEVYENGEKAHTNVKKGVYALLNFYSILSPPENVISDRKRTFSQMSANGLWSLINHMV